MSDKQDRNSGGSGHLQAHVAPTTQQIRTVGQRRRKAEEKLGHHLAEARHKNEHDLPKNAETGTGESGGGDEDGRRGGMRK